MNRDETIRMARKAGIKLPDAPFPATGLYTLPDLIHFAALVAAAEREACAKVCEGGSFLHDDAPDARFGKACAAAIRARGQQ